MPKYSVQYRELSLTVMGHDVSTGPRPVAWDGVLEKSFLSKLFYITLCGDRHIYEYILMLSPLSETYSTGGTGCVDAVTCFQRIEFYCPFLFFVSSLLNF